MAPPWRTVMGYRKALMCPPKHFTVDYAINPWMGGTVDQSKAMSQWTALKSALEHNGVKVLTIEPVKGLPDMVFVCNAGLALGDKVYSAHFKHPERRGERSHYIKWFKNNGYKVFGDESNHFEGGGDAVFSDKDHLWAGFGYRSQKEVYSHMSPLGTFRTIYCELINENFYHLDTCFCPITADLALYLPSAFSEKTRQEMAKHIELVEVSEGDAKKFVCNAVPCGENAIIAPIGCDETRQKMEKRGFKWIEVDMSEFMKSGGACQCLVLKLPD